MKRIRIIMGGVVCILALACTKEAPVVEESPVKLVPITFTVDNQDTKTSLDYDHEKAVNWTDGDRVAIFDSKGKVENKSFPVDLEKNMIEAEVHEDAEYFYALYPYNASATISGNVVTTYIPSEQTAVPGSFGNNVNVAVAYTTIDDKSLTFKNTCALLKFTVGMDDIQSITITANGDYHMTGRSSITYSDGSVTSVSCEGSHSVTLNGPLTNGKTYFVAVAPQTYTGGISMMIVKTDGTVLIRTGKSDLVTSVGTIKSLGTLSSGFTVCDGYYGAYLAGMPLEICGEFVTGANCKCVDVGEGEEVYDLQPDLNNYNGIVFVKGSKHCIFGNTVNMNAGYSLFVVGNNPAQKLVISSNSKRVNMNYNNTPSVLFKNIDLTISGSYFLQPYTKQLGKIHFDSCIIRPSNNIMYASAGAGATSIRIMDSTIIPGANVMLFNMGTSSSIEQYQEITFVNNLVYYNTSGVFQVFHISDSSTASEATNECRVQMRNNIFYNISSNNGLIRQRLLQSGLIGGNIFYVHSDADNKDSKALSLYGDQDNSLIRLTGDVFYYNGANKSAKTFYDYKAAQSEYSVKLTRLYGDDTPFTSFNTTTGAYELKPDYVGYGPQK